MSRRPHQIRIDKVVLDGVSPLHRSRVVDAIERELRRLAFENRMPAAGRGDISVTSVPTRTMKTSTRIRPEAIGAEVARSIWTNSRQAASRGEPTTTGPDKPGHGGER